MRTMLYRCLVVVVVAWTAAGPGTAAAPLQDMNTSTIAESSAYLAKYGYSTYSGSQSRSSALTNLEDAIREFQRFAGLNSTGQLDGTTLDKMRQPRCGVKDKLGPSYRARRRKRYALQGSRWRNRAIKYKIASWPSSVSDMRSVRRVIRDSFKIWQDVSSLTFREVGRFEKAQIVIRFEKGDHGDGDPFDGRGGTLAHAFFPLYGGDAHFDDSERWSANGDRRGTDIFMTASHEFGHSLGLSHSDDQSSLMAPFYKAPRRPGDTDVLTEDDVLGVQALYGPNTSRPPGGQPAVATDDNDGPSTRRPAVDPDTSSDNENELCSLPGVDALFTAGSQKQTYVFAGDKYWRLTDSGVEKGYPRRIRHYWDSVPDNLDAAFSWPKTDRIYFFKDDSYWRMTRFKMDTGYPKLISEGFRGIPDNVDATLQWTGNGKLYFFKGSQYWKFDPSRSVPVSSSYPQPITNWSGLPSNINAALTYSNGRSYFFKKGYYYRFDDARFRVDDGPNADPSYPRPAGPWWFGCKSQSSGLQSAFSQHRPLPADEDSDAVMEFGDVNVLPRRSGSGAAGYSGVGAPPLLLLLTSLLGRFLAV